MSMEEILQSIRKIIAEDDPNAKKPAEAKPNGQEPMAEAKKNEVPGSDVLELTEMLKEDGTVVSVAPEAAKPAAAGDVLSAIDTALAPEAAKPGQPPAVAPAPAPAPVSAGEALLSPEAAALAAASLEKLHRAETEPPPVVTTPAPSFRSGLTIEDMVEQMLRPLMKSWLDVNLPPIVERIVEREVKKLTK